MFAQRSYSKTDSIHGFAHSPARGFTRGFRKPRSLLVRVASLTDAFPGGECEPPPYPPSFARENVGVWGRGVGASAHRLDLWPSPMLRTPDYPQDQARKELRSLRLSPDRSP